MGGVFDRWRAGKASEAPLVYPAKARLYEYAGRYFVCSMQAIAETGVPTILPGDCATGELGASVLKHLDAFSPKDIDLASHKLTDWPAYRASGAKSVKAFERELWQAQLAVMNAAVLVWASPRLASAEEGLSVYASANRHQPEAVGRAVRAALEGAKLLRAADGI